MRQLFYNDSFPKVGVLVQKIDIEAYNFVGGALTPLSFELNNLSRFWLYTAATSRDFLMEIGFVSVLFLDLFGAAVFVAFCFICFFLGAMLINPQPSK